MCEIAKWNTLLSSDIVVAFIMYFNMACNSRGKRKKKKNKDPKNKTHR